MLRCDDANSFFFFFLGSHPVVIFSLTFFAVVFPAFLWVETKAVKPIMPVHLIAKSPHMNLIIGNHIAAFLSNAVLFNVYVLHSGLLTLVCLFETNTGQPSFFPRSPAHQRHHLGLPPCYIFGSCLTLRYRNRIPDHLVSSDEMVFGYGSFLHSSWHAGPLVYATWLACRGIYALPCSQRGRPGVPISRNIHQHSCRF